MTTPLDSYAGLLSEVKARVHRGQVRAALAANRELLQLYWDLGRLIASRQSAEGWGAGVIPRLARDLEAELPGSQGFSARNLSRMVRFFQEYQDIGAEPLILPRPVAQMAGPPSDLMSVPTPAQGAWVEDMWSLPWGHLAPDVAQRTSSDDANRSDR